MTTSRTTEGKAPRRSAKPSKRRVVKSAVARSASDVVGKPVMVDGPSKASGFRALMIHPLAGQSSFALRSWIALLGVASFALAMGSGMLQTANMVGQEVSTENTIPHRAGRVAGATVNGESGIVTIVVQQNANNQTTYQLATLEPLSVFNLFRVASATTALRADVMIGSNGAAVTSVNGIPSTVKQPWRVLVNNAAPASFDEPVIIPGATVTLTLAP